MQRTTRHRTSDTTTQDVLIVGAGPTGLTLATALATRGISVNVIDSQAEGDNTSRAAVVHARTLEVLEPLAVVEALVKRGVHAPRFSVRDRDRVLIPVRFDDLPTRYPYALMISQAETEALLRARYRELGHTVQWLCAARGVEEDDDDVITTLDDGRKLRSRYVVGADGMHSTVRESAGIEFVGASYQHSFSMADVRLKRGGVADEVMLFFSPAGLVVLAPLPGGQHRLVLTTDSAPAYPDKAYLQKMLDARGPQRERLVIGEIVWGTRFRVHHRIAESYRVGRVLLAGDAAHVHSPAGGQGMNTGMQDAIVLADALANAISTGNEAPLEAYEKVRRPIAEQVLAFTDRLTRVATLREGLRPVRNAALQTLASFPLFRRKLAWRLSGLVYRH
jgi:2-polyprenyl-6-methoxyphenol hydroxylase-like FAD-dependent oxidoreductase